MAEAQAQPHAQERPEPRTEDWIAFAAITAATFLSYLDMQIVSSSLAQIQSSLGATRSEVSWVQTSYIIAEVIVVPLAGFLGRGLGLRVMFCLAVLLFAAASSLCAMAWDLNSLIAFRVFQGVAGGVIMPLGMSAVFLMFPPRHQAFATTVTTLAGTLAPTIGPTLGGWISEALSWRWLFWMNVAPALVIATIGWSTIVHERVNRALLARTDFIGLVGLAAMLGAGQYVLEEGAEDGWTSGKILGFMALAAVGAIVFFRRVLTRPDPIVDLSPMRNQRFALATGLCTLLGAAIYVPNFLQPLFLAQVRQYSPMQVGNTMFAQGLTMMVVAPLLTRLARDVPDPRAIASASFAVIALSSWMLTQLTPQSAFIDFLVPQILRSVGMIVCMVTIVRPAYATLPVNQIHAASGLFTVVRLLGGAFGIAIASSMQNHLFSLHRQELYAAANPGQPKVQAMLQGLSAYMGEAGWRGDPDQAALAAYSGMLDREALVMAYNDQFLFLTVALLIGAVGVWLMGAPPKRAAPAAAAQPVAG
ncbi:MAG: DHA2 family efflux MFS transporter permease subunit [Hyphomonadaceae bacterium]